MRAECRQMFFLETAAGMLAADQITLIEDHPDDDGPWPIHYRYGAEIRVTSADGDLVRDLLAAQP